jgi:hypothetical protein
MVMVRPVDFDGQACFDAVEIQDVWPHGVLAPEAEAAYLATAQTDP